MSDGWTETTLGEVAIEVNDKVDPDSFSETRYVGLEHLDSGTHALSRFGNSQDVVSAKTRFEEGDVLFGKLRPYLEKSASAPFPGICSTDILVFRSREGVVTPGFLSLLLQDAGAFEHAVRTSAGTRMPRTSAGAMKSLKVPLPPLPEQRRMVDLLSSIDAAIQTAHERLELGEVASNALREAAWVANDETLVPLSELASIEASMVDPKEEAYHTLKHVGVAQIEKDTGRILDTQTAEEEGIISAKFHFSPEDIIYSKIRPNLRKVALPGFTGLCSADAYPLRPKSGVDPHFLREMLLSEPFTRAAVARSGRTKMPKINRTELFSINIPSPASDVQSRVGRVLLGIREAQEATRHIVDQLSELRAQVLSALLSGDHEIPDSYDRFLEEAS